ncbi:MAG: homoserine O-acetyltransferase [Phycisphaerales bacterium]|nr:homoserine O-acetyltransferase [Phycisphaerales bacterium]
MTDLFTSSDSNRALEPLLHLQTLTLDQPLQLELGKQLPSVTIAYETYGRLNDTASNAILICHALSGDSHVARHDEHDTPGWWDIIVGPGKPIDTNRYFVICSNILGGCRGTTGPNSINPDTGRAYAARFPEITLADMVDVQSRLIDHLGIQKLHAVIGGSLGGHQALTWAVRFPHRVAATGLIATSPRLTSQALAFDIIGRNAILRDPHFHGGQYYDKPTKPEVGLALARMLGHITYLSRDAMKAKFDPTRLDPRDIPTEFEKQYSVGSYLAYQGHKFVERFDANSYITITRAMDRFDLGDNPVKLRAALQDTTCRWMVLSFTSDWLFPPEQSRQMVEALVADAKPVLSCNISSNGGHDSFLLQDEADVYGALVESFLDSSPTSLADSTSQPATSALLEQPAAAPDPTSIFDAYRLDYDLILDLIPSRASVLDLGCGCGSLLALVREKRDPARILGVELNEQDVVAAARRGVNVVHFDLEQPLTPFADQSFDVVVLSQTLQTIADTEGVLREMLRVGRRCIVSFPNFAYRKMRSMLYEQGRSPKTPGSFGYEWYNSPNRRFPSIIDFQDFCRSRNIVVEHEIFLDTELHIRVQDNPNLNANVAIFLLTRNGR